MNNQIQQNLKGNFLLDSESLNSAYRLAIAFHKADCFNGTVENAEQALAVLIAGNEAGLKPAESMSNFYFIKGKLQMYGAGLAKSISRAGIKIKYNKLTKSEVDVSYSRDGELIQQLQYSLSDLPINSQAKKFAPEEKLVYHAHSRFLRYNDVGVSTPYTDYDQGIIESNSIEETKEEDKEININSEILKFIQEEAKDEKALMQIAKQVSESKDVELINAFSEKMKEFKNAETKEETPETSDGALIEENKPTTNV